MTRNMLHRCYYIYIGIGLLLLSPCLATAQDSLDINRLYREAVEEKGALKADIELMDKRHRALQKEVKQLEEDLEDKQHDIDKLQQRIADRQAQMAESKLPALLRRKQELTESIAACREENERARQELASVDDALRQTTARKDELQAVKGEQAARVVEQYQPLLVMPFSKVTSAQLQQAHEACSKFADEPIVKSFLLKLDEMQKNKQTYDHAQQVLNKPFLRMDVQQAANQLQMLNLQNAAQQEECAKAIAQLGKFEDGLNAFKQFIKDMQTQGVGKAGYSKSDLTDDLLMTTPKLQVEERIKDVPYLQNKYNLLLKEWKARPDKHSAVESEILGQ